MTRAPRFALSCALAILAATGAAAQQVKAHMEACTRWDYGGGEFGTRNSCETPTTILFMALGEQRVIERDVPPGAWFGLGAAEVDLSRGWMFTACPVGYAPNVRFADGNKDAIMASLYNCLPARPGA